jgi:hypothetical protein
MTDDLTVEKLHHNHWLSLMRMQKPSAGINGYVYSHETRCHGQIVAVLPFAVGKYLCKSEVTPCWSLDPVVSALTGGYEGTDIVADAVREVYEEAGYGIRPDMLIDLGTSFASKSADTVYQLYGVDVTGLTPVDPPGDGSRIESESKCVWLTASELHLVRDPQVALMYLRLCALQS